MSTPAAAATPSDDDISGSVSIIAVGLKTPKHPAAPTPNGTDSADGGAAIAIAVGGSSPRKSRPHPPSLWSDAAESAAQPQAATPAAAAPTPTTTTPASAAVAVAAAAAATAAGSGKDEKSAPATEPSLVSTAAVVSPSGIATLVLSVGAVPVTSSPDSKLPANSKPAARASIVPPEYVIPKTVKFEAGYSVSTYAGTGQIDAPLFRDAAPPSAAAAAAASQPPANALKATFNDSRAICVDADHNCYVADTNFHRIRKIVPPPAPLLAAVTALTAPAAAPAATPTAAAAVDATTPKPDGASAAPALDVKADASAAAATAVVTPAPAPLPVVPAGAGVLTVAGNGKYGGRDGRALESVFSMPCGVCVDTDYTVYIADMNNHCIRKLSQSIPLEQFMLYLLRALEAFPASVLGVIATFSYKPIEPTVSTLAGTGKPGMVDGYGTFASFCHPRSACVDSDHFVWVADSYNHRIRRVSPAGDVRTIAGTGVEGVVDGPALKACFQNPSGIVCDSKKNVYISDAKGCVIRKLSPEGMVTTFAGTPFSRGFADSTNDGSCKGALFNLPQRMAVDRDDNLFVADMDNHAIRKIRPDGTVSTVAGTGQSGYRNGAGSTALFTYPVGIAVDVESYPIGGLPAIPPPAASPATAGGAATSEEAIQALTTATAAVVRRLEAAASQVLYVVERTNAVRKIVFTPPPPPPVVVPPPAPAPAPAAAATATSATPTAATAPTAPATTTTGTATAVATTSVDSKDTAPPPAATAATPVVTTGAPAAAGETAPATPTAASSTAPAATPEAKPKKNRFC